MKNLIRKISLFIPFFIFCILFSVSTAHADILYVGKDTSFTTIQSAINSAKDNDTILIQNGTYEENVILNKSNIEIIGEDRDSVILSSQVAASGNGIKISGAQSNIKILNLSIQDFLYGIYAGDDSSDISNLLIHNVLFQRNGQTSFPEDCASTNPYQNCQKWNDDGGSIRLKNVTDSRIENNIVKEGERGILIHDIKADDANNIISDNQIFSNQQYGIRLSNAGFKNQISNNIIYDNKGEGITVIRTDNNYDYGLNIIGNDIYQNLNDGIHLEKQEGFLVSNNIIYKNAQTNRIPYNPGQESVHGGIYLANSKNGTTTKNKFDQNGNYGVFLYSGTTNIFINENSFLNHLKEYQSYDDGSFNQFYKDTLGNFWSNLGSVASSTISSYKIDGVAKSRDNYPLLSVPEDITGKGLHLFVSEIYPNQIEVSWNKKDWVNFKEYVISVYSLATNEVLYNSQNYPALRSLDTAKLSLNQLKADTDYKIQLKVISTEYQEISESNIVTIKTLYKNSAPRIPDSFNVISAQRGTVFGYWFLNPQEDRVTSYEIYRLVEGESAYKLLKKSISPNNYFYDSSLNSAKKYSYKIKAKNDTGVSPFSPNIDIYPNTDLTFDSKKDTNKFSSLDITKNTVISRTNDGKSELLFPGDLMSKINTSEVIITGLNTKVDQNAFPLTDEDYSFVSGDIYSYTLTDLNMEININSLKDDALISIRYNDSELNGKSEDLISIAYYDQVNEKFIPLFSQIDPSSNIVTGRTKYLGIFKLIVRKKAKNFSDVNQDDWVYGYLQNLVRSKIINGYDDDTFKPRDYARRAEVLKMSLTASGYKIPQLTFEDPCKDVAKDVWYAPFFKLALSENFIQGYDDKTCRPDGFITRVEALKMILKSVPTENISLSFKDNDSIPDWAKPYVSYASNRGIINGYSDNTFRPNDLILRQELTKILYQAYKIE